MMLPYYIAIWGEFELGTAIRVIAPFLILLSACGEKDEGVAAYVKEAPGSATDAAAVASAAASAPQSKFAFNEAMYPSDPQADGSEATKARAEIAAQRAATAAGQAADAAKGQPAAQSAAKIAYAYDFGFQVAAAKMPALQRSHAALCEKLGNQQCHVLQMNQSGSDSDFATGQLVLEVAAAQAKAFGNDLDKLAQELGGKQITSAVSGEDLSKQIVDTEARLRARLLLRDRLMSLLANHNGSVAELIEAERGVADVNQEIDEAQSELKNMIGRIDFSRVTIDYESDSRAGPGFLYPLRTILGSLASILGWVIAVLIAVSVSLVPIIAFVLGWRWTWRKGRALLQRLFAKHAEPAAPEG